MYLSLYVWQQQKLWWFNSIQTSDFPLETQLAMLFGSKVSESS